MSSRGPRSLPEDVIACLHAIAVGYPIVGDNVFPIHEKFFNPVVSIPTDEFMLALQPWYEVMEGDVKLINEDILTGRLLDGGPNPRHVIDSVLFHQLSSHAQQEQYSESKYLNHPEAASVRRDRGKLYG